MSYIVPWKKIERLEIGITYENYKDDILNRWEEILINIITKY